MTCTRKVMNLTHNAAWKAYVEIDNSLCAHYDIAMIRKAFVMEEMRQMVSNLKSILQQYGAVDEAGGPTYSKIHDLIVDLLECIYIWETSKIDATTLLYGFGGENGDYGEHMKQISKRLTETLEYLKTQISMYAQPPAATTNLQN